MLLGSIGLTPYQVSQMYQTFASGGFYTPLKTVREVLTVEGVPLKRFPVNVHQAIKPQDVQIINSALMEVIRSGTASSVYSRLPPSVAFAGKTGTTNDLKDSWFAGYSGDYLAVSWLGADDNTPVKLTGSSGALQVWTDIMRNTAKQGLLLEAMDDVEYHWIDMASGKLSGSGCDGAVQVAFIAGTAPTEHGDCSRGETSDRLPKLKSWFERLFD
jgi:penicillin-binding protein 1B